jgi:hypothetical protein
LTATTIGTVTGEQIGSKLVSGSKVNEGRTCWVMTRTSLVMSSVLPSGAARETASVPISTPSRAVLHHNVRPLHAADLTGQETSEHVGWTARRIRDNDTNGLAERTLSRAC